jgi:Rps23 Pro-64 3,4-dihydroxylase Tpa1-like proline 4-hydroxylase
MLTRMAPNTEIGQTVSEPQALDEVALSGYGLEVRLVDAVGAGLCQRLRDALPPEFAALSEPGAAVVSYAVTTGRIHGIPERSRYCVIRDGVDQFSASTEEEVFGWLQQDIDKTVARRSRERLFVHAGVVGWRGLGIVILGRSRTGKSTLVAELVRRGAVYYSDEFAVLDHTGSVHPYARALALRDNEARQSQDLHLVWESGPRDPLPIGLIVAAAYQAGACWRPKILRGARAMLPLIDGTVLARQESATVLRIAAGVSRNAVTLQGPRSEATEVAPRILDLVDDAMVSQALGAGEKRSSCVAADLAAIAELRLRSRTTRPATFSRQLVAARYLRITDFLSRDEHQRVLDLALATEDAFEDSGVIDEHGRDRKDYGFRRSRTLSGSPLEAVWPLFDRELRGILPHVRRELGLSWFPLGEVERQLTAHAGGGFFAPHVDTGHPVAASRRISCVYHFHASPRRFTGGELKLYDTWVTDRGSTAAATYTTLTPLDNSIVFFPSDTFHEVCPVHCQTEAFGDSRFAMTIWFREGQWPAQVPGADAPP